MGDVLPFVTASDEEPFLQYETYSSIYFTVAEEVNFIPAANICINDFTLKRVDDISQKFHDNMSTIFD